jgi:holo-[acyl-carrier protein] synthase
MIIGIGIDLVEVERIRNALERHGQRFLDKALTRRERDSMPRDRGLFVASRFAAKEAAAKALGTGFSRGVTLASIEVVGGDRSRPDLVLHGKAREVALELGVDKTFVSLTNERSMAAAVVVLES